MRLLLRETHRLGRPDFCNPALVLDLLFRLFGLGGHELGKGVAHPR